MLEFELNKVRLMRESLALEDDLAKRRRREKTQTVLENTQYAAVRIGESVATRVSILLRWLFRLALAGAAVGIVIGVIAYINAEIKSQEEREGYAMRAAAERQRYCESGRYQLKQCEEARGANADCYYPRETVARWCR